MYTLETLYHDYVKRKDDRDEHEYYETDKERVETVIEPFIRYVRRKTKNVNMDEYYNNRD